MGLTAKLLAHCRKPRGWLGWLVARQMNRSHAGLTLWGLGHVRVGRRDTVLDIGCGGGGAVRRLAAIAPEGTIHGIDHSATSVGVSRRHNRALIGTGRVDIRRGTVSALPYDDGTFDLATAVETHYFWPDLVGDLREVRRVLRPGGALLIVGEAYMGGRFDARNTRWTEQSDMACHSEAELAAALAAAGFARIATTVDEARGWLCAVGRRRADDSAPAQP